MDGHVVCARRLAGQGVGSALLVAACDLFGRSGSADGRDGAGSDEMNPELPASELKAQTIGLEGQAIADAEGTEGRPGILERSFVWRRGGAPGSTARTPTIGFRYGSTISVPCMPLPVALS